MGVFYFVPSHPEGLPRTLGPSTVRGNLLCNSRSTVFWIAAGMDTGVNPVHQYPHRLDAGGVHQAALAWILAPSVGKGVLHRGPERDEQIVHGLDVDSVPAVLARSESGEGTQCGLFMLFLIMLMTAVSVMTALCSRPASEGLLMRL